MNSCRLFASGFRPTFLAAGLAAVVLIPLWMAVWAFGAPLASRWPPTLWHAHEMVFGFIAAAIAGFLLTAVPSWTGQRGFAGTPLLLLVALWLLGRVAIGSASWWSAGLVMAADVAFLPALALLVAPPLLRARNRNTPLLLVLVLLAVCNAWFHVALIRQDPVTGSHAVLIAIDLVLLLVTVIGGRILPAFTASGLRSEGNAARIRVWHGIGPVAIAMMVCVAVGDLAWPDSRAAGILAAAAALIQAVRLMQWRTVATLKQPIVWVLHVAYAWLPVGLALKAAALLGGFAASAFWLHALTIGVLATMILGVMSRAALGHTGRPLVVEPATALAYGLLLLAALTRVFGLAVMPLHYVTVVVVAASFWTAAFAIFLYVYAPILWRPRVDGKPG
jgi:uncharacterized protein involved in response to NO